MRSEIEQTARDRKSQEIRICRAHIQIGKKMGLTEKSATLKKWRRALEVWRFVPVEEVIEMIEKSSVV